MEPQYNVKLAIVFPKDTPEEIIREKLNQFKVSHPKIPLDQVEIVAIPQDKYKGHEPGDLIEIREPVYTLQNRILPKDYITAPLPSKRAQRTSPYAIFDKFHRKRGRKK